MRHYRFYILFVAVLTLSGCADFLDRDPLEQASENTFWKTEADVEKGVNALYPLLPGERDFWRDCESDNSLMTNSWGENGLGYICQGIHNAATGYLIRPYLSHPLLFGQTAGNGNKRRKKTAF